MRNLNNKDEIKAYLKTVICGIGICIIAGAILAVRALMNSGVTP